MSVKIYESLIYIGEHDPHINKELISVDKKSLIEKTLQELSNNKFIYAVDHYGQDVIVNVDNIIKVVIE